jgi:hypothetical protein
MDSTLKFRWEGEAFQLFQEGVFERNGLAGCSKEGGFLDHV